VQIQFNSDNQTDGDAEMAQRVEAELRDRLARFAGRLTRVEIHVGDTNGAKAGAADKRCMIEARPAGSDPIAVTHEAESVNQAIAGAMTRLTSAVERSFGKLTGRKGH
jgi:hypothetical protein